MSFLHIPDGHLAFCSSSYHLIDTRSCATINTFNMTSWFPDPRRIVTGHNSEGRAVVVADGPIPCVPTPTGANFAVLYETHQFPASNDEWVDPTKTRTTDLSNNKGIILRVVDIPPKVETVTVFFISDPRARAELYGQSTDTKMTAVVSPDGVARFRHSPQWRSFLVLSLS
jgi:hypothetical protein